MLHAGQEQNLPVLPLWNLRGTEYMYELNAAGTEVKFGV